MHNIQAALPRTVLLLWSSLFTFFLQAQESFNIYGNRFESFGDYRIDPFDTNYLVFGTINPSGVTCFNFSRGDLWNMRFFKNENNQNIPVYGSSGVVENDSVFLVLGRVGTANSAVIKATQSGTIVFANEYSTGTDEYPDKIIRLRNGDYLVSVRTNVSYYEFGVWGYRSGVMRISKYGALKWFRVLDQRSLNTFSLIIGMHETNSGQLLLTQAYNAKLGLIALNANGDSLVSIRSTTDAPAISADYNPKSGLLQVLSSNGKIFRFDSTLKSLSGIQITAGSLQSLNWISTPDDSTLLLGGDYQNKALILQCDGNGKVIAAHTRNSNLLGLFGSQNGFISLIRQGYMVSRHTRGTAPSCFSSLNNNLFTVNSTSLPGFEPHVPITGSATYQVWNGISAVKDRSLVLQSTNCLGRELACTPDKDAFTNTCPQFSPRLYVTNHGQTAVNSFKLEVIVNGIRQQDVQIDLPTTLGSKSSVFVNLPQMHLQERVNLIEGTIVRVNGETDEYSGNNTFRINVLTRPFKGFEISGPDSVCPGEIARYEVNTGPGVFYWYRNQTLLVKEGQDKFYETDRPGSYHVVLIDSSCTYSSDTLSLTHHPEPLKPGIVRGNTKSVLITDAEVPFIWYRDNVPVDTSEAELDLDIHGPGFYKVIASNKYNCTAESEIFHFVTESINDLSQLQSSLLIRNGYLIWNGPDVIEVKIYTTDGKLVFQTSLGRESIPIQLPAGVFLVQLESGGHRSVRRIVATNGIVYEQ